jgi:hypothetical protein
MIMMLNQKIQTITESHVSGIDMASTFNKVDCVAAF